MKVNKIYYRSFDEYSPPIVIEVLAYEAQLNDPAWSQQFMIMVHQSDTKVHIEYARGHRKALDRAAAMAIALKTDGVSLEDTDPFLAKMDYWQCRRQPRKSLQKNVSTK